MLFSFFEISIYFYLFRSQGGSVSIMTTLWAGRSEFDSRQG